MAYCFRLVLLIFGLFVAPLALLAQAQAPGPKASDKNAKAIPYLGPGADKLSQDEYLRVYSQYIKESVLLGFPPKTCSNSICEQSLSYLFSSSGLFAFPIPASADIKVWKQSEGLIECFESGGTVAQITREKGGALLNAVIIFSKSPKALALVSRACHENTLKVERDPNTGLERVAGVPVGYPHPLLCADSQGLIVKQLQFNNERTDCRPVAYRDNSWASQLRLTEAGCIAESADLQQVWQKKIPPAEFARRARVRQKQRVQEIVQARGGGEKELQQIMNQYYSGPLTHDITMVGETMRDVENCNQLLIGIRGRDLKNPQSDSANPSQIGKPGTQKGQ